MEDPLALTAATAVVSALATHAATTVATTTSRLLSRWRPAGEVTQELEQAQAVLKAVPDSEEFARARLRDEFTALVVEHPEARADVQALVDELRRLGADPEINAGNQQMGSAGGDLIQVQNANGGVTIGRGSGEPRRGWRR